MIYVGESVLIQGDVLLSLDGLQGITAVNGNLWVEDSPNLLTLTGLNNLTHIYGSAFFSHLYALTDLSALGQLTTVSSDMDISV